MTGVLTGETISNKVFGFPKKWYLNVIEVFLFITLLILLFNNFFVAEQNYFVVFTINFFFGITAILATRGIISGAGFFSKKVRKKYALNKELNQEIIIIGLVRNLLRKGLSAEETAEILENSGLNQKKINKIINKIEKGTKKN